MSWEGNSNSFGLQSPSYDTNLQPRGSQNANSDSYYNNAQIIDVPSSSSYQASPMGYNSAPRITGPKPTFSSSGVVQGMETSQWKNKETATNCHLCEAAFSSLAKRKVSCRMYIHHLKS